MKSKDTTVYKINNNLDKIENKAIIVEVIQPKNNNSTIFENPVLTSVVYPVIVTLIVFFITRIITRKKDKSELKKIVAETEKNQEEIKKIKTSYQPIIFSSLQTIQNQLFENKINSLKGVIESKSEFFNVEQIYHEGASFINDMHEYYQSVYLNFSDVLLEKIKHNSLKNASLFPTEIRNKFQDLVGLLYEINDIQRREFSKQIQEMPIGVKEKLESISAIFDELVELIRNDLHLDNRFIHDFISEYQGK